MNRGRTIAVVLAAGGAAAWWLWGRAAPVVDGAESEGVTVGEAVATGPRSVPLLPVDLRASTKAAILGTVTDRDGRPIAGAQVCAHAQSELLADADVRTPSCTRAGKDGRYRLGGLFGVRQRVQAMAPTFIPAQYHRGEGAARRDTVDLRPGVEVKGIDIVLAGGGVEITGHVRDLSGGAAPGAVVSVSGEGVAFADAEGAFSLWVKPGGVWLWARADGYATASEDGVAPGHVFELFLTPEAVLVGKVVRAGDGSPVEGARVEAGGGGFAGDGAAMTDAGGNFRIDGLSPGAYKPKATADDAYGLAKEQVVLGMGETSAALVLEAHPAFCIAGRIVRDDGEACDQGWLTLTDKLHDRAVYGTSEPDGAVKVQGVLPGEFSVEVNCEGFVAAEKYAPVTVVDASVKDVKWVVEKGGTIRGLVVDAAGKPVDGMHVQASAKADPDNPRKQQTSAWSGETDEQGAFELAGLLAGDYTLSLSSWGTPRATPEQPTAVKLDKGKDAEVRITLPATAELRGRVRDAAGKPVPKARVTLTGGKQGQGAGAADDGTFVISHALPGEYRVTASNEDSQLRAPGSRDDDVQGVKVTLVAGGRETVELVVEEVSGKITGVVRAEGGPVVDALIESSRESDSAAAAASGAARLTRWGSFFETPVMTDQDGRFTLTGLPPGKHTLRAHRNGGGEALLEHVEVGSDIALTIAMPGSLGGTVVVRGGSAPDELTVAIVNEKTGYRRHDSFFRTRGAWRVPELPEGDYKLTVSAGEGSQETTVALGEGEARTDVRIELTPRVTVRGTLVDLDGKPVAGLRVIASNNGGMAMGAWGDEEKVNISDEAGRFELARTPTGKIQLWVMPRSWGGDQEYGWTSVPAVVAEGSTVVELPPIRMSKKRVKDSEANGDLGYRIKQSEADADPMSMRLIVAVVRPGGPAATAGLQVGDEVVRVDGQDVTGGGAYLHGTLTRVTDGTAVRLGLARGVELTLTAGKAP